MFSGGLPYLQEEVVLVAIAERLSPESFDQIVRTFQRPIRDGIAGMVDHPLEMCADHLAESMQLGNPRVMGGSEPYDHAPPELIRLGAGK
jgi:hypothetical protein